MLKYIAIGIIIEVITIIIIRLMNLIFHINVAKIVDDKTEDGMFSLLMTTLPLGYPMYLFFGSLILFVFLTVKLGTSDTVINFFNKVTGNKEE